MILMHGFGGIGLELEAEIDRRVDEIGDRRERNPQGRRHAAERQADREGVLFDLQVPEAVLDYDRHLFGKAIGEVLGDRNAGHAGIEGDVEMMAARQAPRPLDLAENAADDVAKRLLDDLVVRNQAFRSLVGHRFRW